MASPDETLIAEPDDPGKAGDQALPPEGSAALVPALARPESLSNVGAVLTDYVDSKSPFLAAVAVAWVRDAQESRLITQKHFEQVEREREEFRRLYHDADKANATLRVGQKHARRLRGFQNWAFGIGSILAGTGLGSALQEGKITLSTGVLMAAGFVVMWLGSPLFQREE